MLSKLGEVPERQYFPNSMSKRAAYLAYVKKHGLEDLLACAVGECVKANATDPCLHMSQTLALKAAAPTITGCKARQIFDSRGNPTVEVDLTTSKGSYRGAVPSGASTGIYEGAARPPCLLQRSRNRHQGKHLYFLYLPTTN